MTDATLGDLYRALWRATARRQILLILLSVLVALIAALPLKFQQLIVNNLVYGGDRRLLVWLSLGFLAALVLSAALKFVLSLQMAVTGEHVVMRIRDRLYRNAVHDHATAEGDTARKGTLVTMLAAEAETVGAFAGTALATPIVQLGTLASVIGFIALSQPWLGLFALLVVIPQAVVVVGLQKWINRRVRERAQLLRATCGRISAAELDRIDEQVTLDFQRIFGIRRRIFALKLSSKTALAMVSALGKVGILFLGGLLVLDGRSDVGTVVASLTGLVRIEGPWRDLVSFFRSASAMRVQYGMLAAAIRPRDGG